MKERLLRNPETVGELTVSIARLAFTLHDDFSSERTDDGWHWALDDTTRVHYEDFRTKRHNNHRGSLLLRGGPRGCLREFTLHLDGPADLNAGVEIYESLYDGSEVELHTLADKTAIHTGIAEVHDVLQQGLETFQAPDRDMYEDQQRTFGTLLLDLALDEHIGKHGARTVDNVVTNVMHAYNGGTGTAYWLLDEDTLRQRAAKRMADFGGDIER